VFCFLICCQAERAARSAERSREKTHALWIKNNYESKKLPEYNEEEEEEEKNEEQEDQELVHVIGDCSALSEGSSKRDKIVVVIVNRSGVFGSSRFFSAVLDKHGRTEIERRLV
jgi:hypothetical protein